MAAIASLTPRIHSRVSWPRDPSRRASRPRDRHPEIARALAEHLLQAEVAWKARHRGPQLKRPTPMPATCCNRPALRHWVSSFSRPSSEPPLHPPRRCPRPLATLSTASVARSRPGPLQLGPPGRRCTDQPRAAARSRRPSMPPVAGSQARSGWGIRPSTLPAALVRPATSPTEPLGLSA